MKRVRLFKVVIKKEAKREITPLDEALLSGDMKSAVKQYKASQKAKITKTCLGRCGSDYANP